LFEKEFNDVHHIENFTKKYQEMLNLLNRAKSAAKLPQKMHNFLIKNQVE